MVSLTPRGDQSSYILDASSSQKFNSMSEIYQREGITKKTEETSCRIFKKVESERGSAIPLPKKRVTLKAPAHSRKKLDIDQKEKKEQKQRRATNPEAPILSSYKGSSSDIVIAPLSLSGINNKLAEQPEPLEKKTNHSKYEEDRQSPRKTWKRHQERRSLEHNRVVLEELPQGFDSSAPISKILGAEIFKTLAFSTHEDFIRFNGKSIKFSVKYIYKLTEEQKALPVEAQKVFAHELIQTLESYRRNSVPLDNEIRDMINHIFNPFMIFNEDKNKLLTTLTGILNKNKGKTVTEILEAISEKSCSKNFVKWAHDSIPRIMTTQHNYPEARDIVSAYYNDKHLEQLRNTIPCFFILQSLSFNAFGQAAFLLSKKITFEKSDKLIMKPTPSVPCKFEILWNRDNGQYSVIHRRPYTIFKTKMNKMKQKEQEALGLLDVCWTVSGNSYFVSNQAELSISNLTFNKGAKKAVQKKIRKQISMHAN